jgi:hypothetical protein
MAYLYENFNVVRAKRELNNSISKLKIGVEEELLSEIMNNTVWSSNSRDTLYTALNTMVNVRYPHLKKKLESALKILNDVEEYKKHVDEIKKRQEKVKTLKPGEWVTEEDEEGNDRQVYHGNDDAEIERLKMEIKEHEEMLDHYKHLINSALQSF